MTTRRSRRGLTLADIGLSPARAPKYGAEKATGADGSKYDSKAEARRHGELMLLERAGEIRNLKRQVRFELLPAVRFHGSARATPAMVYVADFTYDARKVITAPAHAPVRDEDEWVPVIEDCKGARTRVYLMKRHMMKALLGLDIRETKPR